ncbi:hypothetical protein [Planomonospora venezuelensis]|uniref:Uncharacterized protein n=1 Tax=Planomonospora venezuelensis TaxID=1999 RepID=A0A841DG82_PLAVE|nr:hypothetical protein [Planomonospora venezuelensis]MBB5968027.1 hypothetical protein [Planomonospora venezuelensis]GIM98404.1 hypothetical protein Pve01_00630 [Planomonospora venezuelensis]
MYTRHAESLLDLVERTWVHRLRRASLAAEIDAEATMAAAAAAALGEVYRGLRRGSHHGLARRWPACVVVALSAVAATGYRSGSCWPAWWSATRYRGRAADAGAFGEAFLTALGLLGLPGLPEQAGAGRYVGPIMMHAGVPTSCLAEFFRFLLTGRSDGLDEPVHRFMEHGGDYAADLAERCLDLLDRLRAPEPDLEGLALPARVVDHALALVRDGLLDPTPEEERPQVLLAPFGQGVLLRLPEAAGPRTVTVGGETVPIRPGHPIPVARPVASARIHRDDGVRETGVRLVDPADPLLVFTENGRQVPAGRSLPADVFWAVFPGERELTADEPLRIVAESLLPPGWPGWRLVQVAPARASWIALDGGPRRRVSGRDRPRVHVGEPVAGVTGADGSPVVTGLSVWLPGGGATWSVEARRAGEVLFRGSFTPDRPVTITDVCGGTVLGEITLTVRGPIGRGARRTVTIAEGLAVRYEPELRLLAPDGLQPATARLSGPAGTVTLDFGATETERACAYGAGRLVLTPPHMRIATDRHGWRTAPLRLAVEELDTIEWLRIDGPEGGTLEVRAGGRAVQRVASSARGRHNPRRILDTVAACRGADLMLPPDIPVAYIRPAGSFSAAGHLGDRLVLADLVWLEGLVAELRPDDGPGEVVPVPRDGTVPLPPRLAAAAALRVRLAVPDPWTGPNWPPEAVTCRRPPAPGDPPRAAHPVTPTP